MGRYPRSGTGIPSRDKRLSREQLRVIHGAEPLGISAISLTEIAMLRTEGPHRVEGKVEEILDQVENNSLFRVLPITGPIALDARRLSVLRDPADRTIAATARMGGLRLLTSNVRMISSNLVSVIE